MIEAPRLREEIEQNGLVIALEKIRVEASRQIAYEPLDHAAAIWATVHIVAKKDE